MWFKLPSSDSLVTWYLTIVIPEQICMAWVNVMTPALCGLFKLSDSLGTEYNFILDVMTPVLCGLLCGLFKLLSSDSLGTNMYGLS